MNLSDKADNTGIPDQAGSPGQLQERRRDRYAEELHARFAEFRRWAVTNWPVQEQPLTDAAFVACERELALLTGAMLHPGRPPGAAPAGGRQQAQFEDVTPAPWP